MKLLIVYGSTEGQTRKICEFLRDEAVQKDHQVELDDSTQNPRPPGEFDAVIIGASVHASSYQTSVEHYVQKHQESLKRIPGVFISVSLTAASNEPESWKELYDITQNFLNKTGWIPQHVEQVAGALKYTEYNFFKRFIMRMIAQKSGGETDTSKDYEYTDWKQVKNVLTKLEHELTEIKNHS